VVPYSALYLSLPGGISNATEDAALGASNGPN
jgi:hypothetical protein